MARRYQRWAARAALLAASGASFGAALVLSLATGACEKNDLAERVTKKDGAPAVTSSTASSDDAGTAPAASQASVRDAAAADAYPRPERPVPTSNPTVTQTMPEKVQILAIQYMVTMSAPRPDDPNADAEYAAQVAEQLKPIVMSFDKGSGADKQRMNRVEVAAGGRKLDLLMARGCDQHTPKLAVTQRAGISLSTLFGHGVLVVRCQDDHVQCLQSTRDDSDILCTIVPRKH
jgi:hypothetical protein